MTVGLLSPFVNDPLRKTSVFVGNEGDPGLVIGDNTGDIIEAELGLAELYAAGVKNRTACDPEDGVEDLTSSVLACGGVEIDNLAKGLRPADGRML